ncbi:S1 RNA-binding domain-containing protein [Amycolatopsis japonica]|uniref:S1 RNA-binding domain-containing protein n=1 Tax=Amycolatopsis japonica TaxID=208439 RepID=UPI0036723470
MSPTENWREFVVAHADGGVLDGVVTRVLPFGAFVEVAPGMEGLLPTVGAVPARSPPGRPSRCGWTNWTSRTAGSA